jgi:uncharacterized protein with HEPN domain
MCKSEKRLHTIFNALEDIEFILKGVDFKITKAVENKIIKPALRMHIIRIAEQFNKLKEENEFEILEKFDKKDLRGINAVRNFIAHDYDNVEDVIIENVLRYNFPELKNRVKRILKEYND